jgi:hypothetical protein
MAHYHPAEEHANECSPTPDTPPLVWGCINMEMSKTPVRQGF